MRKISLHLVFIFSFMVGQAQMGSIGFSLGLPQNNFKENTDATGFGLDLSYAIPLLEGIPVYSGLNINYMVYGRSTRKISTRRINNRYKIINTNKLFGTHLFVRAVVPFGSIQPYGEVLFGFRTISTITKIRDKDESIVKWSELFEEEDEEEEEPLIDSNVIARLSVLNDWILSYGFGGGLLFNLSGNAFLDLRIDFFRGQKAQYYDGSDTESWIVPVTNALGVDDITVKAQPRESTTDLLVIKFGVAFKI